MEIRVPEVGESVREALVAKWFRKNGDAVNKDEPLCEIETDKITLDLNADAAGVLTVSVPEGTTVKIGAVIGSIEEQGASSAAPGELPALKAFPAPGEDEATITVSSPAARREMRQQGIAPESVIGSGKGGRITLDDLIAGIQEKSRRPSEGKPAESVSEAQPSLRPDPEPQPLSSPAVSPQSFPPSSPGHPEQPASVRSEEAPHYATGREERRPMSPIRRRIAERLVTVRQQTAMLTTFNEADLGHVKALRTNYREHFQQRHGITLGYMPFFVKACVEALKEFPSVNASIDGDDIVYHHYFDIGIAMGAEKGLVVPVLRDADRLKLDEIEQAIAGYVEKIKGNRLAISDLEGGTFTISNGGVYGSMLSTPILNPPQSGVLGMHAIQDRPVARDGQVVIRPMMYLALSYDHRIIDGREAVGFLRKVKEYIEEPEELLLEG